MAYQMNANRNRVQRACIRSCAAAAKAAANAWRHAWLMSACHMFFCSVLLACRVCYFSVLSLSCQEGLLALAAQLKPPHTPFLSPTFYPVC